MAVGKKVEATFIWSVIAVVTMFSHSFVTDLSNFCPGFSKCCDNIELRMWNKASWLGGLKEKIES